MEKKELSEMVEREVGKKVGELETKIRQEAKENLDVIMDKFNLSTRIVCRYFSVSHQQVHLWLGPKFLLPELKHCKAIDNFIEIVDKIEQDCKKLVEGWQWEKGKARDVFQRLNFNPKTRKILSTLDPNDEKISRLVRHTLKSWIAEWDKQEKE